MSKRCTHKTVDDHVVNGNLTPPKTWICGGCGKKFRWVDGVSGYYGNIECAKCGTADIEFVYCSKDCRGKFTPEVKKRGRPKRQDPKPHSKAGRSFPC